MCGPLLLFVFFLWLFVAFCGFLQHFAAFVALCGFLCTFRFKYYVSINVFLMNNLFFLNLEINNEIARINFPVILHQIVIWKWLLMFSDST